MPDGQTPFESDPARSALDAARRHLEAELAHLPDWIALRQCLAGHAAEVPQAILEARLELLPAYRALRDLDRAAGLLSTPDELPFIPRRHERDMLVPAPEAIELATLVGTEDSAVIDIEPAPARDDLTRIRGIDATLARRLAGIGICRFDQIAAWSADDVRTIAHGLGLGRAFIRHGVIEQAAALAHQRGRTATWATPETPREAAPCKNAEGQPQPNPEASAPPAQPANGITGWTPATSPPAHPPAVRGLTAPPPALLPAMRQSILARIRRGPRGAGVVSLVTMAPELAQSIFIALEADQPTLTPRWKPRPFDGVPAPIVVTEPMRRLFATAKLPPPVELPPPEPEVEPPQPAAVPAPPPLHEIANRRLDALEAELTALTRRPATAQPSPLQPMRAQPPSRQPSRAAAQSVAQPSLHEAAVEIRPAAPPGAAALAPLPDLPLRPTPSSNVAAHNPATTLIEEAAVTIVRRTSSRPKTPDLPRVQPAAPSLAPPTARGSLKELWRWARVATNTGSSASPN